ncbi:MAG: hypothetical protein K2Y71_10065 [Xanthobacteraceae bacterium]|nr:hypothetical protein [Xanthobacteraceae bacterium]
MDIRTLVLGLGVFCATFLLGWWLNIGSVLYGGGTPQPRPALAAESASTTGQGRALVAHVPVSSASQSQTAQPKAPAARLPQIRYAQEPKAKTSSGSSSSRPAIRVRRR